MMENIYYSAANVYYGTGGSLEERKKKPTKSHQYRGYPISYIIKRIEGDDCYSDGKSQISIWIIIWLIAVLSDLITNPVKKATIS